MSRLKGADLGVTTPSLASLGIAGALNYRGAYSTSAVYAPNDVMVYNGVAYRANVANGPGVAPPLTGETTAQASNGTTSGTFTIPATANVGDVAYVVLSGWSASQVLSLTGWTQVIGFTYSTTRTDGQWFVVYRKTLVSGDPGATVTVSWSFSDFVAAHCRTYYGVHDVASAVAANTLTTPTVTPTSYPSTVVSLAGVGASVSSTSDVVVTAPSGTSNFYAGIRVAAGAHNNKWAAGADETLASGTSTARTFGDSLPSATDYATAAVAVKPVSGTVAFTAWMWTSLGPVAPLNYRGVWAASPSPAYAANDVALRNGLPYIAALAPGSADPVGGALVLATQSTIPSGQMGGTLAQGFTPTATITVTKVEVYFLAGAPSAGGQTVGISSEFAQGGTPTMLGSGVCPAGSGWLTITLNTPVTLQAGTKYRLVVNEQEVGTAAGSGAVVSGLTLDTTVWWGTTTNSFPNNLANTVIGFRLDGNPWTPLPPAAENVNTVAASGSAVTLPDVTTATMHKVTLTAATPAITLPAPGAGKSLTVELVQDATGGRAPTWVTPSGAIRWPGGTAPTITATANAIDVITFVCIGGTNWYGFVAGQAFA